MSPVAAGVSDGCVCSELLGCLGDGLCALVLTERGCRASLLSPAPPELFGSVLCCRARRGRRQLLRQRVESATDRLSANPWPR